jgi:tetratricopeptide (TPR) repeat protein
MNHQDTKTPRIHVYELGVLVVFFLSLSLAHPQSQPPTNVDLLLQGAQTDINQGKFAEAATKLKQALDYQQKNKTARAALIEVLMRLERWDEAGAQLEILRSYYPGDSQITFVAAGFAFRRGEFQKASNLAADALKAGDQRPEVYRLQALSRYMLQDFDGFEAILTRAIQHNPADSESYYHLGRYRLEKKKYSEAIQFLSKALEFQPDYYKAYYFQGLALQGSGDLESAKKQFRKAIEIIEKKRIRYGWAYADLGELLVSQEQYTDGVGWLYRGVRNDPNLPYTHFKYAGALLKQEVTAEVESELKSAIRLDPAYAEAYYVLGRYYSKTGDKEKAREAFAKFEELRKNPQPSPFGVRRQEVSPP